MSSVLWWKLRRLKSRDPRVRIAAVKSLEMDPRPEAEQAIVEALRNWDDRALRFAAAEALSKRGGDNAIRALVDFVKVESDAQLCGIACDSLITFEWHASVASFDDADILVLRKAAQFGNEATRVAAARAYEVATEMLQQRAEQRRKVEEARAAERARKEVSRVAEQVKKEVAAALNPRLSAERERINKRLIALGSQAVKPLNDILRNSNNERARIIAGYILGEMREPSAVQPLAEMWTNEQSSYECKRMARENLCKLDRELVIVAILPNIDLDSVLELLDQLGWQPRTAMESARLAAMHADWETVFALGGIGNRVVDEVISGSRRIALGSKARLALAMGLAARGDDRAVKVAAPFLRKGDFDAKFVQVLAQMDSRESIDALLGALREGGYIEQSVVANALASRGNAVALSWILDLLHDNERTAQVPNLADYVKVLERGLDAFAANFSTHDLHSASTLRDAVQIRYACNEGCNCLYKAGEDQIDCSRIRQLARQEVGRRNA
jgi:HEAT repeat protein